MKSIGMLFLFVAMFALGELAMGGPIFGRKSSPCANGQCSSGVCAAPVAFEAPVAREAKGPPWNWVHPKKAAEPCACGVACPCGDQSVAYYAAPVVAQKTALMSDNGSCGAQVSFKRPGILARIFHRRR